MARVCAGVVWLMSAGSALPWQAAQGPHGMYCGGKEHVDMGGLRVSSIEGTVLDPTGAAIPKARVQVQVQYSGKMVRNFSADSHGRFTVAHLPTDDYWLGISGPGFNLHYWRVHVVHHGHKFTLRAELSPGS